MSQDIKTQMMRLEDAIEEVLKEYKELKILLKLEKVIK